MTQTEQIAWLLEGDVSIQYQTHRDLLGEDRLDLQRRITTEGWGAAYLQRRNTNGTWGRGFYQPKWISSHYTLLDLKLLNAVPDHPLIQESIHQIARNHKSPDGGIDPHKMLSLSDVCINGMFLNYACYFKEPQSSLESIIDCIIDQQMNDGGFNCQKNRSGAAHSSLHSTLSVLEGILEYQSNGYLYRSDELERIVSEAEEFILIHRLFKSDKTGQIIKQEFLKLSFPPRWKYNILRCLDYFRAAGSTWDDRMSDAVEIILKKRRGDGYWPAQSPHTGQVHFKMEEPGKPGRWNTLLALRVLQAYDLE